jgi:hypothetical protein
MLKYALIALLSGLCLPTFAAEIENPQDNVVALNAGSVRSPILSSDGEYLVYQTRDGEQRVLAVRDATGPSKSFLLPNDAQNLVMEPGNQRIWFTIGADVYAAELGTGKLEKRMTITEKFEELFLSPKGEPYALIRRSFSKKEMEGKLPSGVLAMDLVKLHRFDAAGKAAPMTRDLVSDYGRPLFLPNGDVLTTSTFISDDMTAGARDVTRIDAKGKRTKLTNLYKPCDLAALARDGTTVAVTFQEHKQDVLHVLNVDTLAAREVGRYGNVVGFSSVVFSPDGQRLAYVVSASKARFEDEGYIVSLGGGGKAPVFASKPELGLVGFKNDGRTLVYTSENSLIFHEMVDTEPRPAVLPGFVAPVQENGRWTLIDMKGRQAFPYWAESSTDVAVRNGLIVFSHPPLGHGYRDLNGRVVVTPSYTEASPMSEGFGVVKKGGKCGYIDAKGKVAIDPQFTECREVSEGLAIVKMGEDWGFVDMSSKLVYHGPWQSVESFKESRAEVKIGGRTGFVDRTGELAVPNYYDDASPFRGGYARVKLGDKLGFVDPTGKEIIKTDLDKAGFFSEGLVPAIRGKTRGWLDARGRWVLKSKAEWGWEFHDGLARFRQDGLYGFIDNKGQIVIPAKFKSAEDFNEGLAAVCGREGCGWVDGTGNAVAMNSEWTRTRSFFFGVAAFEKENKWGYVDRRGQITIEPRYDAAETFVKVR